MKYYRNLSEYLEEKHQTRNDVVEDIAEAALTVLLLVEENGDLQVKDIIKLSEPLQTLYGIVTKVNENISSQKPESI